MNYTILTLIAPLLLAAVPAAGANPKCVDTHVGDRPPTMEVVLIAAGKEKSLGPCSDQCAQVELIAADRAAATGSKSLRDFGDGVYLGQRAQLDGCDLYVFPVKRDGGVVSPRAFTKRVRSQTATDALELYAAPEAEAFRSQGVGVGAVNEAIGILGQIVADRASNKGYVLAQERMKKLLRCDKKGDAVRLPATCQVLGTLRLQDIASSGTAFVRALTQDLVGMMRVELQKVVAPKVRPVVASVLDIVEQIVVASVLSQAQGAHPLDAQFLADALVSAAKDLKKTLDTPSTTTGVSVTITGIAAFAECARLFPKGKCPIDATIKNLDKEFAEDAKALSAARLIATNLYSAIVLPRGTSARTRLSRATTGGFEALCAATTKTGTSAKQTYTCPKMTAVTELSPRNLIGFGAEMTAAVIDADSNRLVTSGAIMVELLLTKAFEKAKAKAKAEAKAKAGPEAEAKAEAEVEEEQRTRISGMQKGLRLAATLVQYAITFRESNGQAAADRHEARTKILESFTEEMTVRTGRGGDLIFSVGGSLKGAGGIRLDADSRSKSLWGPASLSLGLALDKLSATSEWGGHVELGLVELGNYLSWDEGLQVSEPDVQDAFTLSLMVAAAYGHELPIIFGPVVGFSPSVGVQREGGGNSTPGSWFIGGAVGVYVPLFDFN